MVKRRLHGKSIHFMGIRKEILYSLIICRYVMMKLIQQETHTRSNIDRCVALLRVEGMGAMTFE